MLAVNQVLTAWSFQWNEGQVNSEGHHYHIHAQRLVKWIKWQNPLKSTNKGFWYCMWETNYFSSLASTGEKSASYHGEVRNKPRSRLNQDLCCVMSKTFLIQKTKIQNPITSWNNCSFFTSLRPWNLVLALFTFHGLQSVLKVEETAGWDDRLPPMWRTVAFAVKWEFGTK